MDEKLLNIGSSNYSYDERAFYGGGGGEKFKTEFQKLKIEYVHQIKGFLYTYGQDPNLRSSPKPY